jgi:hypothetical protein
MNCGLKIFALFTLARLMESRQHKLVDILDLNQYKQSRTSIKIIATIQEEEKPLHNAAAV